ncbi:MAG: hypothetical protein IT343_04280 [Candidatus Melainabacteria bacterium]|jgi:hypothetical protein|nr:hypothetical protein [Candidatus Melainabacteria bacterium]
MEPPLTLVTSQAAFDQFFSVLDWHSAFVKESHFAVNQYLSDQFVTIGEGKILRILFVLPSEAATRALELVAYDVKNYWLSDFLDDCDPVGIIKKRDAELEIGPFVSINASCLAYRWVDNKFARNNQLYTRSDFLDANGKPVEPYNIDWKTELDLASK